MSEDFLNSQPKFNYILETGFIIVTYAFFFSMFMLMSYLSIYFFQYYKNIIEVLVSVPFVFNFLM